jgi:hypothetical protein
VWPQALPTCLTRPTCPTCPTSTPEFFQMLRNQYGLAVAPARREVTLLVVQDR